MIAAYKLEVTRHLEFDIEASLKGSPRKGHVRRNSAGRPITPGDTGREPGLEDGAAPTTIRQHDLPFGRRSLA